MNKRTENHRIVLGTVSSGTITAATAIRNWTSLTDQAGGFPPWTAPRLATPSYYDQTITAMSGKRVGVGYRTVRWEFSYWTFNMLDYFLDTFLTVSSARVQSASVSIQNFDHNDVAEYLNCTLNWPDYTQVPYGWKDIKILFTYGTVI